MTAVKRIAERIHQVNLFNLDSCAFAIGAFAFFGRYSTLTHSFPIEIASVSPPPAIFVAAGEASIFGFESVGKVPIVFPDRLLNNFTPFATRAY